MTELQNNSDIHFNFAQLAAQAPYVQAASNKFVSELSADKAEKWPLVLASSVRPGANLQNSWWLYAQWLLCKIGEALPEDTHPGYLCNEVCSLYELGCNNALVWSDVIAAIDEIHGGEIHAGENNANSLSASELAAVKALREVAQTGLVLVLEQAEQESLTVDKALELSCLAIMANDQISRHEVFELAGSQFLHAVSLV